MYTKLFCSGRWMPMVTAGVLCFTSCAHKLAPEGHYQDVPVVVDGSVDEWPRPLRFSDEHYTLQYNVTNDDKNIYVAVSSGDVATQLRILRSGLTVWFDPAGKKNKTIGLYFPLRKELGAGGSGGFGGGGRGSGSPDGRGAGGDDYAAGGNGRTGGTGGRGSRSYDELASRKAELLIQSNYYNTTGFLEIENGQFGITDSKSPIQVAIKSTATDSLLVYELKVPIRNVLGADWKIRAAKKNFSVGLVLNTVQGMPGGGGGGYGGGRPYGGGGGMRGMGINGMRGIGQGRRGGGGSPGQKEEDTWYVFRLASK